MTDMTAMATLRIPILSNRWIVNDHSCMPEISHSQSETGASRRLICRNPLAEHITLMDPNEGGKWLKFGSPEVVTGHDCPPDYGRIGTRSVPQLGWPRVGTRYIDITMSDPGHTSEPGASRRETSLSMFDIVSLLVRRRKPIAIAFAVVLLPTLVILLLLPNRYESTASILPSQSPDKLQQLRDVAGISLSSPSEEGSSELYPVILRSRLIKDDVLAKEYAFTANDETKAITFPEYFDQTNRDKLYAALDNITTVSFDKKTGVVSLGVETRHPELSQLTLQQYIVALETYNLHSRKSKARENEKYLARELALLKSELLQSQDSLRAFQEQNRTWNENAHPWVLSELARLKRDLAVKDQSFLFLSQEYESAKLKAQMDIPIVQILDEPSLPIQKSGPYRLFILIVVGVTTALIIIPMIVIAESFRIRAALDEQVSYRRFRDDLSAAFPTANRLILRSFKRQADKS